MESIVTPIRLQHKIDLNKDHFLNEELSPYVKVEFECPNCGAANEIRIVPYTTGYPFSLVYEKGLLSEEEILDSGLAELSLSMYAYLGNYLVWNLPTLYFKHSCPDCNKAYLVVYGLGESQPGKWDCKISGVWEIEELKDNTITEC